MKLTSARFSKLIEKLRAQVKAAAFARDLVALQKPLARLNKVCAISRARNLANGMTGKPWENTTSETVFKSLNIDIQKVSG